MFQLNAVSSSECKYTHTKKGALSFNRALCNRMEVGKTNDSCELAGSLWALSSL
jgi:hypothetical protein